MTKLSNLRRPEGAHRAAKRVGRGPGSGIGKTSGRGHKGHKSRSGGNTPRGFEGGQMPLQRRLPKRGFKNPFRKVYEIVNLRDLDRVEEETITPEVLQSYRLVDLGKGRPVKVLGDGRIRRKVVIRAHAVSAGARSKIEAAGGSVELLES